jgi:hypothetical protein
MQKIKSIKMIPVDSAQIESIGYDSNERVLAVRFNYKRRLYYYLDVPEEAFQEFLSASSIGKYFHGYIKNVYEYEKIQED